MSDICFDIDGVICLTQGGNYITAIPREWVISFINKLYKKGHFIIIATARGMKTGKDYTVLTRRQLKEWGVKYHILLNKPYADFYIDDHNATLEELKCLLL